MQLIERVRAAKAALEEVEDELRTLYTALGQPSCSTRPKVRPAPPKPAAGLRSSGRGPGRPLGGESTADRIRALFEDGQTHSYQEAAKLSPAASAYLTTMKQAGKLLHVGRGLWRKA